MAQNSDSPTTVGSGNEEKLSTSGTQGPPRALLKDLETPPALAEAIRAACELFHFQSARDRLYLEEELKLQYYYGGQDVACVPTPHGRAVVATGSVGSGELRQALQHLSPAERRTVSILFPEPWDDQTLSAPSVFFDED